jgi:hypothetical protein
MKPDSHSWTQLHDYAESRLRPGLAARTLRAVRASAESALVGHFAFSAAAAAVCLVLVMLVHTQMARAETARNLADWQAITREVQKFTQLP